MKQAKLLRQLWANKDNPDVACLAGKWLAERPVRTACVACNCMDAATVFMVIVRVFPEYMQSLVGSCAGLYIS